MVYSGNQHQPKFATFVTRSTLLDWVCVGGVPLLSCKANESCGGSTPESKIYRRNYICSRANDNGSEELLSVTGNEATAFINSRSMRKQCMILFIRSQCGLSTGHIIFTS